MYAYVQDGAIDHLSAEPPHVGRRADGRTVSGYHLLPPSELAALGWVEVQDAGPPAHDPATQRVDRELTVTPEGGVVADYTVTELPPQPPNPHLGQHLDPVIGARDA